MGPRTGSSSIVPDTDNPESGADTSTIYYARYHRGRLTKPFPPPVPKKVYPWVENAQPPVSQSPKLLQKSVENATSFGHSELTTISRDNTADENSRRSVSLAYLGSKLLRGHDTNLKSASIQQRSPTQTRGRETTKEFASGNSAIPSNIGALVGEQGLDSPPSGRTGDTDWPKTPKRKRRKTYIILGRPYQGGQKGTKVEGTELAELKKKLHDMIKKDKTIIRNI
ncbi:hypothetical protein GGR51DRAFT_541434 [Nemania sp. FL0031]|nr:hypothetical protein GGR51DRAFT_541434 [Nemania sp. FL0031]